MNVRDNIKSDNVLMCFKKRIICAKDFYRAMNVWDNTDSLTMYVIVSN